MRYVVAIGILLAHLSVLSWFKDTPGMDGIIPLLWLISLNIVAFITSVIYLTRRKQFSLGVPFWILLACWIVLNPFIAERL